MRPLLDADTARALLLLRPMTPYYTDPWLTVYQGDCRSVLETLPAESVHCVVTSPPYFGLRDYGDAGQLGLEGSVEEYVAQMVVVFRAVRRVMRHDATLWLNLGDSFGSKQLLGIPWRVAFALQADGWYLRSDIIWAKPNPMPESVTDRPTKSHEYLFLLAKSERYFFDADAVREPNVREWDESNGGSWAHASRTDETALTKGAGSVHRGNGYPLPNPAGRNIRSVWQIATQPYPGAHFAVFPPKLVEPCIKAGTSERGVCPECGAPWRRVVERESRLRDEHLSRERVRNVGGRRDGYTQLPAGGVVNVEATTTGWEPTCSHTFCPECGESPPCANQVGVLMSQPATVLDPFAGSGTTLMVAQQLSRRAIGIDLSMEYLEQLLKRNAQTPLGLTG